MYQNNHNDLILLNLLKNLLDRNVNNYPLVQCQERIIFIKCLQNFVKTQK